jgi:hypothetical protein
MTYFTANNAKRGNYTVTRSLSRSVSKFTLRIDKKYVVGSLRKDTCVEVEVTAEGNKNLNAL